MVAILASTHPAPRQLITAVVVIVLCLPVLVGYTALLHEAHGRGLHVGLVVVDVDHFERVNDTHGHDGGDAVLSALGCCPRCASP